jgi:threonine dehydratase
LVQPSGTSTITAAEIEQSARALSDHLIITPLQFSYAFTQKTRCEIYLKLEGIQPTRAFKVRGALNKLGRLDPQQRSRGVITASAGNHGQGVAYASRVFGIPATVYVPLNANPLKIEAIKRMGARVVSAGNTYVEAYAEALLNQGELTFVHAYDDLDIIAGQGTVAVEIVRALSHFDTILVPVGGGGLLSGVAAYLKEVRPSVRIIAVEPSGAACLKAAHDVGKPVSLDSVATISYGLAENRVGSMCFEIIRPLVDELIVVEDSEMMRAIRLLFEWEHILAEPAGAAALAAVLYHHRASPGERVVIIQSGANITDGAMLTALKSR